ncbi:AAA family ATPase [Sorangium cellulosum]|uniref:AAA family ATPase n=1 Tax=Sorangium cellulosum TaxID=56 RepID=UPI001331BBC1|nr:AAA family ATPase [Sorangium cellulosum]
MRRLEIHDLRCFQGKHVLDFADPVTGDARDRVVLVGSNGSGKTTVFDVIEAMLAFVVDPDRPAPILDEAGLVGLTIEQLKGDLFQGERYWQRIVYGKANYSSRSDLAGTVYLRKDGQAASRWSETSDAEALRRHAKEVAQGKAQPLGGLIYFPHDRELRPLRGGTIEPPPDDKPWISRYSSTNQWTGSLEQLWVWQNYLDLERKGRGEAAGELAGSVELLQEALGPGRKVFVREGRVRVTAPWNDASGKPAEVMLDQLPSGERQCVMLLGEIARRQRPHGVLFIDEPEISMHPTLQRQLLSQLRRIARLLEMQVFLATHSPEIVRSVPSAEVRSLDYPESRFDAADESAA